MQWDSLFRNQLGVFGMLCLFGVAAAAMFAFLLRLKKRLARLREQLEANDAKLRSLYLRMQQINSSNGNALGKK